MLKPLPARLLRYALYLCASLLICVTILLWQAPNLIQRHLPGWLATHYGLHLTLGEIDVGLRSPSLTLGPPPCSTTSNGCWWRSRGCASFPR